MVLPLNLDLFNKPNQYCLQQLLLQELLNQNFQRDINQVYFNPFQNQDFDRILSEVCQDCSKMSSLPQGALFVCKMRETTHRESDHVLARMKVLNERSEFKNVGEDNQLMNYSPVKYNEKLMKSIWGQYNRYSPHNIKTNVYEKDQQGFFLQQHFAVAGSAIAETLAMAYHSGREWCFGEH